MNLIARQLRNQRQRRIAGEWHAKRTDAGSGKRLFDASFDLAEAARDFDLVAGIQGTAPVTAAVLSSATTALHSQADALQRIRSLIRYELAPADGDTTATADLEELSAVLEKIEDNLRFSASEADRARHMASAVIAGPDGTPEELPDLEPEFAERS